HRAGPVAVDAQHLLPPRVLAAGEDAGLGGGGPAGGDEDAARIGSHAAQHSAQAFADSVVADEPDGKDARAERGNVCGGVCAAPQAKLALLEADDEDRRLAADAIGLAVEVPVGDEILYQDD